MRYHSLFILFILFFSSQLTAQDILVTDVNSHELFSKQLDSSKELKYQEILQEYDRYLTANPASIDVMIMRCKFIGLAYYDNYEEYNPNWEETDACINALYERYPTHPEVIVYNMENSYGEEKTKLIEDAVAKYYKNIPDWKDETRAELFRLAAYHYADIDPWRTREYAGKAQRFDKELDLSLLIAETHMTEGEIEKAREVLVDALYYEHEVWTLNRKGNMLVDLEEYDKALEIFDRVKAKDSSYLDTQNIYKILLNSGKMEIARSYLVDDTLNAWGKLPSLQRLLEHDMNYASTEIALQTYERVQQESYYDDFFGIKRLQIFFKDPIRIPSSIGYSHLLLLLLLLALLFVIPYLWIMPIYGISRYFGWKFHVVRFWNLKHFWIISFLYLLLQTGLILLFNYQEYMNYIFEISSTFYEEEVVLGVDSSEMIAFSSLLLVSTLLLMNKGRLHYALRSRWSIAKILGLSIGFFIFNLIVIRFLGIFVDIGDTATYIPILNIKQEILALMNEHGFLMAMVIVAVFAPFYEEIIFRGIILNSTARHIGFTGANIVQASLFGLIHFNLALFPFYFIFGMVTGYVAKRSNGLLAGIIFHAVNNFIVLVLLYYVSKVWNM